MKYKKILVIFLLVKLCALVVLADPLTSATSHIDVSIPAVCGNGACESGETCSSCSADCGSCTSGGGHSHSSSTTTLSNSTVSCGDWTLCVDGYRSRECISQKVNFTQRFKCGEDYMLPNQTALIVPEVELLPNCGCEVCPECPVQESCGQQVDDTLYNYVECDLGVKDRLFLDDSRENLFCNSAWCNDGWFKNACQNKPEKLTEEPAESTDTLKKEKANLFLFGVAILLLGSLLYMRKRRKKMQQQPNQNTGYALPSTTPVQNKKPRTLYLEDRLQPLYLAIKDGLMKGYDKYTIIEAAKRKGWMEDDLEKVFEAIQRG